MAAVDGRGLLRSGRACGRTGLRAWDAVLQAAVPGAGRRTPHDEGPRVTLGVGGACGLADLGVVGADVGVVRHLCNQGGCHTAQHTGAGAGGDNGIAKM